MAKHPNTPKTEQPPEDVCCRLPGGGYQPKDEQIDWTKVDFPTTDDAIDG